MLWEDGRVVGKLRVWLNAWGGVDILNAMEVVEDIFKAKLKAQDGSGVCG